MKFSDFKKIFDYMGNAQIVYLIEQKGKRITDTHKMLREIIKSSPIARFLEVNTSLNDYSTFFSIGDKKSNTILMTKEDLMPILKSLGLDLDSLIESKVILKKYRTSIEGQYCRKKDTTTKKRQEKAKGITTKIANAKNNKLSDNVRIWVIKTKASLDEKSTKSENKMNYFLRKRLKMDFEKNKPFRIKGRQFFADFYIKLSNAIIEVDGGYHDTEEQREKDSIRDAYFESIGIKTYRIKNEDVYGNSPKMNDIIKNIKKRKTTVKQEKREKTRERVRKKECNSQNKK